MEISFGVHQDTAVQGGAAPGMAGTGQESMPKNGPEGRTGHKNKTPQEPRSRSVIRLGMLAPVAGTTASRQVPETPGDAGDPDDPEVPAQCEDGGAAQGNGDLIFSLYERQERIAERLDRKIESIRRRLDKIEERGRLL